MKDKVFLQWIHDRLRFIHEENINADYMHKLRAIIADYDEDKITPNVCSFNKENPLKESLKDSFITCNSGSEYYVKAKFQTLGEAQLFHRHLISIADN